MRTIYNTATTLNGYIADERNSLDWLFAVDDSVAPDQEAFLAGVTVLVLGSTTYEWVVEHEDLVAHPERWPGYFGPRPLFVFTTRELPVPAGADVRLGDGDAWLVGGGDLAGQLLDAGALDEVQLSVAPAALTGGAPVLPRTVGADRLRLRTVEQFGQFAHLTYDVVPVG